MQLFLKVGVSLKQKKCNFFAETIDYIGHVIRPDILKLAEHTTDAVAKLEHLTKQTKLSSFLGLRNVFRRFIPNLAHLAVFLIGHF